ncbi:MAG: SURF1 family protein [Rhodobacter sp.]|jgi:surfeit locus 1 family protein|nr:SURF1 family protein [Rhodobacter sp.]
MTRRMILPALFGLSGVAILIWLGVWQLQRLEWKTAVLAQIATRLHDAPVGLPDQPREDLHQYLAVVVDGTLLPGEVHVLTSQTNRGPGYRVIQRLQTGNRIILIDRGFIAQTLKAADRPLVTARFEGNLLWPNEIDETFTPDPDLKAGIWFARDLPAIAAHLGAEQVLLVLRASNEAEQVVIPWPVNTEGVANNHFQYAMTWFSLAVIWLGMTGYLLWRIRQKLD